MSRELLQIKIGDNMNFMTNRRNMMDTVRNVLMDVFNTTGVFYDVNSLTMRVYNVDFQDLRNVVNMFGCVHDMDYDVDYDYYDNLVYDTDCVVLYFHDSD